MDTMPIDGKAIAERLRLDIARKVEKLKKDKGITPGLAVVLVGADPASEVYVRNKARLTREAGMHSYEFRLPEFTSEAELLAKVQELNAAPAVHGILVQLPLPKQINPDAIINAINPDKDVDGFHVINAGLLATGLDGFVPCTPLGCLLLLQDTLGATLAGKHAVIIGRSNIVGKPLAALLLREHCTVTITHSHTKDLQLLVKTADIVIAAIGKPEFVKGSWIKPGAVVIDVGINRVTSDGQPRLVGDVAYGECLGIASAITPVPGGVGPMTIACLLGNTLRAAES